MIKETIVYILFLIGLLAVSDNQYSKKYYVPFKTACSALFLLILGINMMFSETAGILFYPLIACFLGDVLMGLYNTYAKKKYILIAIVTFLIGHVGFIYYMCENTAGTSAWVFLLPLAVCVVMAVIYKISHLHMGRVKYYAFVYCYFVSAMCIKAIEFGGLVTIAGVLFFLSDFSIMFLYFYHFKDKKKKVYVHYFNLITYYIAILLFIFSAV